MPTGINVFGAIRSYGLQKEDFKAVEINYTPGTKAIDITIFEERRGAAVPLSMKFNYVPSLGSVPIHEVADSCNLRIKNFYSMASRPSASSKPVLISSTVPIPTWLCYDPFTWH